MTNPNPNTIAKGKVVALRYTLRNEAGEWLDGSEDDSPLSYLHGAENIVPGLEAALAGRAAGDKFQVKVAP